MKHMSCGMDRVLAGLVVMAVVAGCGGKAGVGAPGNGVDLKYNMGDESLLKYRTVSESIQNMKIQAMEMKVRSDKRLVFSIRPEGLEKGNRKLAITVDSLVVNVASPQGDVSADASDVIGKSFEMALSPTGEELDLSGADSLEYELGMAGKQNVLSDFESLFPDLAGKPIEIGDSWTSLDTTRTNEGGGEVVMAFKSVNTLEGFETVAGMECARISAVVTGTLTGEGEQGGAKLTFDGTFSGRDVWHFAYKKGVLVNSTSADTLRNKVTMTGPQEMVIPVTQTSAVDVALVGRDGTSK